MSTSPRYLEQHRSFVPTLACRVHLSRRVPFSVFSQELLTFTWCLCFLVFSVHAFMSFTVSFTIRYHPSKCFHSSWKVPPLICDVWDHVRSNKCLLTVHDGSLQVHAYILCTMYIIFDINQQCIYCIIWFPTYSIHGICRLYVYKIIASQEENCSNCPGTKPFNKARPQLLHGYSRCVTGSFRSPVNSVATTLWAWHNSICFYGDISHDRCPKPSQRCVCKGATLWSSQAQEYNTQQECLESNAKTKPMLLFHVFPVSIWAPKKLADMP